MDDLVIPLLKKSTRYYRGVGFFTSNWLKLAIDGLQYFVENGGKARYIISPILEKNDWYAIKKGNEARKNELLKKYLSSCVSNLRESISRVALNLLSWLVADEFLEFRFALPKNNIGIYHDKVAVFIDNNEDIVAFHGSFNDSKKSVLNGEAVSVFKSWNNSQKSYVYMHRNRLLALWEGKNKNTYTMRLPEAIKKRIIQLRDSKRPYSISNKDKKIEDCTPREVNPSPLIELRDYQKEAVNLWMNSGKGIFEMATGTGKTITALSTAKKLWEKIGKIALLITVPYGHLVDQWHENCENFSFEVVPCSGEHKGWTKVLKNKIIEFKLNIISNLAVIAVVNTASTNTFQKIIDSLPKEYLLFIGDEMHVLGAQSFQKALVQNCVYRLGLSATPFRWYDNKGTKEIHSYFGGVIFEYGLSKAIRNNFLSKYFYYPRLVSLTKEEEDTYSKLTERLKPLLKGNKDTETEEIKKNLLIKRARIISQAKMKMMELDNLIDELKTEQGDLKRTLFYCPPGKSKEVLKIVAGKKIRAHEFVSYLSQKERRKVLDNFELEQLQAIVAIKCLDEGIDIPATEKAIFIASTTNPREFIQRRGRILRLHKGKSFAYIYDFIVVPNVTTEDALAKSLLRHEMPRFAEFTSICENKYEARKKIKDILDQFGVLHYMDIKPWDIYREAKMEEGVGIEAT